MSMQSAGRKSKLSALSLTFLLVSSGLLVLPLFATPVSAIPPVVMNEWYQDTDCNGHVDAVTFRMTQPVHDVSIRPSDFKIDHGAFGVKEANGFMTGLPTYTCDPGPAFNVVNSANRPPGAATCPGANDACFTLLFPEGLAPDGGPQSNGANTYNPPAVSFVNDPNAPVYTHDDPVGSKMANLGSCTTTCRIDSSPPILMAAYGRVGDAYVTVVFSENVAVTSGGVNAAPAPTDFCVRNGPATVGATGVAAVNSFPANNFPNRVYRLSFANAANVPQTITDQSMLNNMLVVVGSVGFPGGTAPAACPTNLGDSQNPGAHNVVPYKAVYVGAPTINRVYANAGDEQLIAEFAGPVWDGSNPIPGNSFTVVAGGGSGITGLNNAIVHAGGNDRALLTTTSLPSLQDIAVTGRTTSIGTTSTLVNANTNFLGTVVPGTTLQITASSVPGVIGTYTVTAPITATSLTFTPAASAAIPTDSTYILSEPGARIRVEAGKVVGYRATGVGEPQSSTDLTTGCADNIGPTPPAGPATPQFDFCLVDAFNSHGAPHVEQYITQDADSDGCIDNIKLVWNENILDTSFAGFDTPGEAGPWQVVFPSGLPTTSITLPYGDAAGGGIRRAAYMVTSDPGTGAPSTNDQVTYLIFSDDCGLVRATGTATAGSDTDTLVDNNVGSTIGSAQTGDVLQITSGPAAGTYSITAVSSPSVTFSPPAPASIAVGNAYTIMTARTVGNTGTLPVVSFCDGQGDAPRSAACSGASVMTDLRGNSMLSGSVQGGTSTLRNFIFRHPTVDGAKPVATYAYTEDATRNGYIDRITVGFSEAIAASSVNLNAWTATIRAPLRAGCPLADGTTYTLQAVSTSQADPTNGQTPTIGTSITPNPTIEFTVVEKSGLNPFGDTGCVPDLTYNGAILESSQRTAGAPQSMNAIAAGGAPCSPFLPPSIGGGGPFANNVLCESDGAQPVFQNGKAIASVNTNVAVVTFSEPVFGSGAPVVAPLPANQAQCGTPSQDPIWPSGVLTPADFSYDDNSNGGVTGITAVTMVGTDCRKWQLTLNGALTSADVDGAANPDCLRSRKTSTTVSEGIRDGMPSKAMPTAPSSPRIGNPAVPTEDQFSECIEFTQGPPPLSLVETVDSDHDGVIDALRLTFTTSVSDPFSLVLAGDSDIGAAVSPPAQSSGYSACWVDVNPLWGANSAQPQAEDLFYADITGTCAGGPDNGDFRYSALPNVKPVGSAVVTGEADDAAGVTFVGPLLRVRTPGTSVAPNIQDKLYFDADGSGTVTAGDRRLAGFDDRFWDVSIGGVAQIVTGISTGQLDRVYSGTAGAGTTTTSVSDATRNFLLAGVPVGSCVTIDGATSVITAVAATTLTFAPAIAGAAASDTYTLTTPWHGRAVSSGIACEDLLTATTAPSGPACHDSDDLLPNQAGDAILYVCIEEQRDGQGRLLPNTGATNFKVGYNGNTIVRMGAENPGSPVSVFSEVPAVDAAQPVLVRAVVTPTFGSKSLKDLTLTFSEPVMGAGGTKDLSVSDFSYVNGNTGSTECIEGASSVAKTYVAPTVVGTGPVTYRAVGLDGALSVHDIGSPLAVGTVGPACANPPDRLRAIPGFVKEAVGSLQVYDRAVRFIDDTGPQVESAGFIDADGDGIVDAVQVKFNEYINDAGKLDVANINDWGVRVRTGTTPDNQPVYQTMDVRDLTTGQLGGGALGSQCQNTYNGGGTLTTGAVSVNLRLLPYNATRTPSELVPITPYGAGGNDEYIFICLNPDEVLANGGTKAAGTAITGVLTYTGTGTGATGSRLTDVFAAPGFPTGSPLADIPFGSPIPIVDMARPVVLNECRRDTTQAGVACPTDMADRSVETADRNGNGAIDAMRVVLSEPIQDATVNFNQWSVSNVGGLGFNTGTVADDNEIFLTFTEASDSDSGIGRQTSPTVPDVSYFAGGTAADKAATPNLLRGVASGACTAPMTGCADERDGAAPTIRQIAAQPGTNLVTVRFSERVGSGTHGTGALTSAQVAYSNAGGSGASAITSMSHSGDTLTLTLNGNLDAADVANDKLVFTDNSIYEAYCGPETVPGGALDPTPYPHPYPLAPAQPNSCYRELELAVALRLLSNVVGSPPTAPTLTLSDSDATSVTLTWTAATDPDNDLAGYEILYCACPVFFAGGATTVPVPLATSPTKQVTGLTTDTQYSFIVRAVDAAGNKGPNSNEVQTTAQADDTDAPCAVSDLKAGTQPTTTSVTLSWTVPKEDCTGSGTGGPATYLVAVASGSITSDSTFDAAIQTTGLSFSPTPGLVLAGTTQTVTVGNLQSGTTYTFAVKAVDAAGNKGPLGNTDDATIGAADAIAPGAVSGLDAVAGDVPSTQVRLRFTAPGDDLLIGTVRGYEVRFSENAITSSSPGNLATSLELVPSSPSAAGQSQHIIVKGLKPDTTYNFTVKAKDEVPNLGPVSQVVSHKTAAGVTVDLETIQADFARTVKVTHSGSTNTITWGDPPEAPGLGPAIGVQLWKLVDGEWTLLQDVPEGSPEFTERSFQDEGSADDKYKATVYFTEDASGGYASDPSDISNFDDLATASAASMILGLEPWLFWLLVGILVLIVIVVAVLLAMRAKRARSADMGDEEDEMAAEGVEGAEGMPEGEAMAAEGEAMPPVEEAAEESAAPAAVAAASEPAAPSQPQGTPDKHYLTCPKCATEFTAFGIKPLAIQCPNCGVRGTLR